MLHDDRCDTEWWSPMQLLSPAIHTVQLGSCFADTAETMHRLNGTWKMVKAKFGWLQGRHETKRDTRDLNMTPTTWDQAYAVQPPPLYICGWKTWCGHLNLCAGQGRDWLSINAEHPVLI